MKKLSVFFVLLSFIAIYNFAFTPVAAVGVIDPTICNENPAGSKPAICDTDQDQNPNENVLVGPNGVITKTAQWLVYFSGVIALILIIIAGFMFVFSSGDPQSAGRARSTILYAVAGLTIAVVGQAIVSFVLERLNTG